jgi:phosphoribosylformylglycinamidine synthase
MTARVGVVVFPGTNCEHDVALALGEVGADAVLVWHGQSDLSGFDAVVVPGGFAHGDYLRPGAIARFSPVVGALADYAAGGGPVVGICNGFQVLTEAGLLPGALQKNRGLRFMCVPTVVTVASSRSVLTAGLKVGTELVLPLNNFDGSYVCAPETLAELRAEDRVVLRYRDNPNGSVDDIAGICNEDRNVVGLMPHPERASSELLGSADGLPLLRSLVSVSVGDAGLSRESGRPQPSGAPTPRRRRSARSRS